MKHIILLIIALLSSLTASADKVEYKYYISLLTPYDFEVDGIYYSFGIDTKVGVEDWEAEPMVSVAVGLKEVGLSDFATIDHDYYSGDVVVPATVTYEGVTYKVKNVNFHAFAYCNKLNSVTLPETVEVIGYGAFAYCPNLTKVHLPSSLWYIWHFAFYNCESLEEMPMPDGVTYIGPFAFSGCNKYAFHMPDSLECVYDWGENAELSYSDAVVLPSSVKIVYEFPKVRILTFGDNIPVDEEGKYPLIAGTNQEIILPEIMEKLVLPKAKFNLSATLRCNKKLERIVLPEVESFILWWSASGFEWNENPGEFVSMGAVPPEVDGKSLGDCYDATLVVPAGSEEAYRNAPVWCEFKNIRGDADIQRYLPGDTGGIKTVETDDSSTGVVRVYNLSGILIGTSTEGLPSGIYIVFDGNGCRKVKI